MSNEAPLHSQSTTIAQNPNSHTQQEQKKESKILSNETQQKLRLASLFSGGKDSTYATHLIQQPEYGQHTVSCLVSLFGRSEESMLLHNPNIRWVDTQARAMHKNPPLVSDVVNTDDTQDELDVLESLLLMAKSRYHIQGVVHGGIRSEFQKSRFAHVCEKLNLKVMTPLWRRESPILYMKRLLDEKFEIVITAVSAGGLDQTWLGRHITYETLEMLAKLAKKHGFALDFEGGEAETFVTNCPLFKHKIVISKHNTVWDGYRGRFEILDILLDNKCLMD